MADAPLRLVIVTPEKTLLDEPVAALRFPLYDGDIGILPGRLPLIGRLGTGELKVQMGGEERTFFIDAGFVQVRKSVVTLLTRQAVPTGQLSASAAEQELTDARNLPAFSDDEYRAKLAALNRARRMLALSRR